jgi:hypothetical protein
MVKTSAHFATKGSSLIFIQTRLAMAEMVVENMLLGLRGEALLANVVK